MIERFLSKLAERGFYWCTLWLTATVAGAGATVHVWACLYVPSNWPSAIMCFAIAIGFLQWSDWFR